MPLPTLLVPGSLSAGGETQNGTPVDYIQTWIRQRMPEFGSVPPTAANRVLVVTAETGSGKSTVLPVTLLRILRGERNPSERVQYRGLSVLCTQPRVLTAVSLTADIRQAKWAQDVAPVVGYVTGPLEDAPKAGLVYATIGVLTAMLAVPDADLTRFRFIVVDEAHERSLQSDMCLWRLREYMRRHSDNPRLPFVLLASATLDAPLLAAYFGVPDANCLSIVGRAWPIRDHFLERECADYTRKAAEICIRIHEKNPDDEPHMRDILVFMPGAGEALLVQEHLGKLTRRAGGQELQILIINREAVLENNADFRAVFAPPKADVRRLIIATAVAETGVTVPTVKYVVDCGWCRSMEHFPAERVAGLVTRPTPRTRMAQRRGRAGRLAPGEYYALYTEAVRDALPVGQLPDVVTQPLGPAFPTMVRDMQAKHGAFRVEHLDEYLTPPPAESFLAAASGSYQLGFIEPEPVVGGRLVPGWHLTRDGEHAAQFARTEPEGVRMILSGPQHGAAACDLALLAALLGARGRPAPRGAPEALRQAMPRFVRERLFLDHNRPAVGGAVNPLTEPEMDNYRLRLLLADDFLEDLLLFDLFADQVVALRADVLKLAAWCAGLDLSYGMFLEINARREEVMAEMARAGLSPQARAGLRLRDAPAEQFADRVRALKRCLADGLRCSLLRLEPDELTYRSRHGIVVPGPPLFSDQAIARFDAIAPPTKIRRPAWVLTGGIVLKAPRGDSKPPLRYKVRPERVSVLDGWVDVDETIDLPEFATRPDPAPRSNPGAESNIDLDTYEGYLRLLHWLQIGQVRPPLAELLPGQRAMLFAPQQVAVLVAPVTDDVGHAPCGASSASSSDTVAVSDTDNDKGSGDTANSSSS